MRRSFAPSFHSKKSISVKAPIKEVPVETQNSARSTSSILDLLNDNKLTSDSNTDFSVSRENDQQESNIKPLPIGYDDVDGNLPDAIEGTDDGLISDLNDDCLGKRIYNVVWGKLSKKKHKSWEGDGVLEISSDSVVLKDCDGKCLGTKKRVKTEVLEEGSRLVIGSKEIELIDLVVGETKGKVEVKENPPQPSRITTNVQRPHKRPRLSKSLHFSGDTVKNALVMSTPSSEHQWVHNASKQPLTDVVVDSFLSNVLRPHQRDGIRFLYDCVLGMKNPFRHHTGLVCPWRGCILADEMGLGKTLQCITLIWTLLRKGPYGGKPMIRKVLIVTPSSLVENWQKEFQKWLGKTRISPFVVNQKNKPKDYLKMPNSQVMVISYEMVVRCIEDLKKIPFELLICDEGHRLKNTIIKTSQVLSKLSFKSRILLTGTPIQNDLQEFYSLIDFVNPGILGSTFEFRKHFETPIVASRQPNCSQEVKLLGEARAAELHNRTEWFVLRRTQAVINKYLPGKREVVIFCQATPLQVRMYKTAIKFWEEQSLKKNIDGVPHLKVLTAMKKICNHPRLVLTTGVDEESLVGELQEEFQRSEIIHSDLTAVCGKLRVLENLLENLIRYREKVILVSYFTKTMDMFASFCESKGYTYCRLDGSVPSSKRMTIVDSFNQAYNSTFIFLLSARAGGVGLNLTGASRLILYDSDWNPATDLQAMARIWRDGQKKSVYIYRFLTTGTIEEKIFLRQVNKTGLSGAIVDPHNKNSVKLSMKELRDLFTYHENTLCLTHDLLNCKCLSGENSNILNLLRDEIENDERDCQLSVTTKPMESSSSRMNQLNEWQHFSPPFEESVLEEIGLSIASGSITFIFKNTQDEK